MKDDLQDIQITTREFLINALQKQRMIKSNPMNLEDLVIEDICEYLEVVKALNDERLDRSRKQFGILTIKFMNTALNRVRNGSSDIYFNLFYSYHFQKQSIRSIALQFGVDEKMVKRANKKLQMLLAIFLYPDLVLSEMMA